MRWLLMLCALAAAALAQAGALFAQDTLRLDQAREAAARAGKGVAVWLTLPECAGCAEMASQVFTQPALAARLRQDFVEARIDLASPAPLTDLDGASTTAADFARRLRLYATPSLAFFAADGALRYRYTGVLNADGLRQLLDYVRRGDYDRHPFVPRQPARPKLHAAPPPVNAPQQPQFSLSDSAGQRRSLADWRGRVVALAVGYTHCPDVCPTTLSELKTAIEQLPAGLRGRVQGVFATLDPARDSAAILAEYAAAFRPRGGRAITALRGDGEADTTALVRALQLHAERQPAADGADYTLDHSAGIYLFDARGRWLGVAAYQTPTAQLRADLLTLARRAGAPHPDRF